MTIGELIRLYRERATYARAKVAAAPNDVHGAEAAQLSAYVAAAELYTLIAADLEQSEREKRPISEALAERLRPDR